MKKWIYSCLLVGMTLLGANEGVAQLNQDRVDAYAGLPVNGQQVVAPARDANRVYIGPKYIYASQQINWSNNAVTDQNAPGYAAVAGYDHLQKDDWYYGIKAEYDWVNFPRGVGLTVNSLDRLRAWDANIHAGYTFGWFSKGTFTPYVMGGYTYRKTKDLDSGAYARFRYSTLGVGVLFTYSLNDAVDIGFEGRAGYMMNGSSRFNLIGAPGSQANGSYNVIHNMNWLVQVPVRWYFTAARDWDVTLTLLSTNDRVAAKATNSNYVKEIYKTAGASLTVGYNF